MKPAHQTLDELKRNAIAALAVLLVIGLGAMLYTMVLQ